jgi:mono/diheme cytochrome c family protein
MVRPLHLGAAVLAAIITLQASAVASPAQPRAGDDTREEPRTTYERFLPLAVAGDPDIQHFLGFIFFYGEGVEMSYGKAHYWFHLAAEQGDTRSQRNLGIFHARLLPRIPEKYYAPEEANLWFSLAAAGSTDPEISMLAARAYGNFLAPDAERLLKETEQRHLGEKVFSTFCAGCHGFDGHSPHPGTPSFALGESLAKRDDELVASIRNGKNLMPAWRDVVSEAMARATVRYIRKNLQPRNRLSARAAKPAASHRAPSEDERTEMEIGEATYLRFCGGCHGFNGIAKYVNSPSFALGERLEKSDEELILSVEKGRGVMPSWENMLQPEQIAAAVKFIRTLSDSYKHGIGADLRVTPERFFRFRPGGERGPEWSDADPTGG